MDDMVANMKECPNADEEQKWVKEISWWLKTGEAGLESLKYSRRLKKKGQKISNREVHRNKKSM